MSNSLPHKLSLVLAFALATLSFSDSAFAQCTPAAPVSNTTVTCTGTVTNQNPPNGYGTGVENNLTINVTAGASVMGNPGNGIDIANGNTINNLGTITLTSNSGMIANATAQGFGVGTGSGNVTITTNSGTISGDSQGINSGADVNVTNTATGKILATGTSGNQAIGVLANTATIDNFGQIAAGGANVGSIGISTIGLTMLTNESGATISSSSGTGVQVNNAMRALPRTRHSWSTSMGRDRTTSSRSAARRRSRAAPCRSSREPA